MRSLFTGEESSLRAATASVEAAPSAAIAPSATKPVADVNALITGAAKDLADYQRLTAEGKLGEAGQKLEQLKRQARRAERASKVIASLKSSFL